MDMSQHFTKVYIFDLYDIATAAVDGKFDIIFPYGNLFETSLYESVSRLYLSPYIGR